MKRKVKQRKVMSNEFAGKTMALDYFLWKSCFFKWIHNNSLFVCFKDIIVQVSTVLVCLLFSEYIPQINGITRAISGGVSTHSDLQLGSNLSKKPISLYLLSLLGSLQYLRNVRWHSVLGNWTESLLIKLEWADWNLAHIFSKSF